jgi:hypothetical protein
VDGCYISSLYSNYNCHHKALLINLLALRGW